MPIVLILMILILFQINRKNIKSLITIYIISIIPITYNMTQSHKEGTAIFKTLNYKLVNDSNAIVTNDLVNYYLKANGNKSKFYNIDHLVKDEKTILLEEKIILIGDYSEKFKETHKINLDTIIYHNPYMNRMWSEVPIYTLEKKNE